jgi:transcription elongation factor Elf1
MPKLVFGPDDRDKYTLRRVVELSLAVAFECRNCHKLAQSNVLDLVERYGLRTKLGELRAKAVCRRCGKRAADVLMRDPGMPRGREWWPRPPLGTR